MQRWAFLVVVVVVAGAFAACGGDAVDGTRSDDTLPSDAVDAGALSDGGTDAPRDLASGPCPEQMALVDLPDAGSVCIDRYEGALVEILDGGAERPWPYSHQLPASGVSVRAIPAATVKPQGYISQVEATAACRRSGKRLCTLPEWMAACQGPQGWTYPYGNTYVAGACNEGRSTNPVIECFGAGNVFTSKNMNDPCCLERPMTVLPGGSFPMCVSAWGVYDLHGSLHEWIDATASTGNGIFKGGFFVDAKVNGAGCNYRTTAHAKSYHDYSTGFRCCADPR